MLGKTNLVLDELSGDVSLVQETVLTDFSSDFEMLNYINRKFFIITSGKFLIYGDNVNSLVKVDMSYYPDTVIFANDVYYVHTNNGLFFSTDLATFDEITIEKTIDGNTKIFYDVSMDKFIIVNYEKYTKSSSTYYRTVLYTTSDLSGEWEQIATMTESATQFGASYSKPWYAMYANGRVLYSYNSIYSVYDLSGGKSSSAYFTDIYAGGFFWIVKNNTLYKSLNGGDYSKVYTYSSSESSELKFVKDYNGYIAFVGYIGKIDDTYQYYIAVAAEASATAVEKAMQNKVEFTSDYEIYDMVCVDDTIYFSCSSGIIIEAQFGNEEEKIPADVILIKTLSAKQALTEAKSYTDEKYAELEARIAVLESI